MRSKIEIIELREQVHDLNRQVDELQGQTEALMHEMQRVVSVHVQLSAIHTKYIQLTRNIQGFGRRHKRLMRALVLRRKRMDAQKVHILQAALQEAINAQ